MTDSIPTVQDDPVEPPIWQPLEIAPSAESAAVVDEASPYDLEREPEPTWVSPSGPAPSAPAPSGPAESVPPPLTSPLPLPPPTFQQPQLPAPSVGRVPGWVWPTLVLALLLGLVGGLVSAVAYQRWQGRDQSGLSSARTSAPLPADNGSVAAVAQELLPSTVQIVSQWNGGAGGATGSGFVVDREGHIVTNNHVVADAVENDGTVAIVDQDGNQFEATVVGRSPVYDLAVLSCAAAKDIPPAALGSSSDLMVGEPVVAFGSPLGMRSTVTSGIVSALNRPVSTGDTADDSSYINAVQTDAAINPGNSGGPLVNLRGQVVGVNSAIATVNSGLSEAGSIGVGFAIPIDQVKITTEQILDNGEAEYPIIGATVQTNDDTVPGATIADVTADSPADQAGLEADDVITEVDGVRVFDSKSLIVAIRSHQPGETISLTILRSKSEMKVRVTLAAKVG